MTFLSSSTPLPSPTSAYATLESWLFQRIRGKNSSGDQLVYATGRAEAGIKYLPFRARTMSIERYLAGHQDHLYGSWLGDQTGKTRVLAFDNDGDIPIGTLREAMTDLAGAGAWPIYWARRSGRGHLEIYFDDDVDRDAARAWAISCAPRLSQISECYPLPGIGNALSWPLWYRVGHQVQASTAYFAPAWNPLAFHKVHMAPNETTLRHLAMLVSTCITPAALVPPLPPPPPREPRKLVKLPQKTPGWFTSSRCAHPRSKDLIAWFNATHRLDEIHPLANARYARAIWRNERTPSVKYYPTTNTWCDFGSAATVRGGDAFELACLVEGKRKHEKLAELRQAWQGRPAA
jgi:hypothetical protein